MLCNPLAHPTTRMQIVANREKPKISHHIGRRSPLSALGSVCLSLAPATLLGVRVAVSWRARRSCAVRSWGGYVLKKGGLFPSSALTSDSRLSRVLSLCRLKLNDPDNENSFEFQFHVTSAEKAEK